MVEPRRVARIGVVVVEAAAVIVGIRVNDAMASGRRDGVILSLSLVLLSLGHAYNRSSVEIYLLYP